MSIKFIALSGTVSVTENLYIYESDNKMMIIDCGVGFPDLEMRGVDLVLPDFSYVVQNKEKLVGIVVSQGHEDHIGALPFLLREMKTEIWAPPLVKEFLVDKFKEYEVKDYKINSFNPDNDRFNVGPFTLNPFRVTHSVPDTVGFAIDTPQGRIFHVPEHKMDQNPVDGMRFNIERARELARGGVLFLASDCLGANKAGFAKGESEIEGNMLNIVKDAQNTVFMTAISSNIGRFQQMINVAQKVQRKVIFVGRSIQKKAEIAHNLGILKYPENLVISFQDAEKLAKDRLMYIVSGCYGQDGSSLYKLALGEHERIQIEKGDTLLFSADPAPPYTKESEDFVIDEFIDKGVDVHYYDLNEGIYVSGHGSQEDIKALFDIVRPKYFIPIGGAIRFMHSYKKLVVSFGAREDQVFTLKPGENVIFDENGARIGQRVTSKKVLVHGLGIGDIGRIVLGERSVLGTQGVVVVIIKITKREKILNDPKIFSKGFIFEKIDKGILIEGGKKLRKQIEILKKIKPKILEDTSKKFLEKFFFDKTGRRPMVMPIIINI